MRIKQTYDDWIRMLVAVDAANEVFHEGFSPEKVVRDIDDAVRGCEKQCVVSNLSSELKHRTLRVSQALGIDKQRKLSWQPTRNDNSFQAGPHAVCYRAFGEWDARSGDIEVSGHPNAESAMAHLERLLARDEK